MDYGDIFIGTFGIIWRRRLLLLFGLLGQLGVAIGGVIYSGVAVSAVGPWISFVRQMAAEGAGAPSELPVELGGLFARLSGGIALFLLMALIGYVINLIVRAATIHEAGFAWAGDATSSSRGLRAGRDRMLQIFGLDLLWYVPIWIVSGIVLGGAFVVWIAAIAAFAGGSNGNGDAAGSAVLLGLCGLVCCGLVFFLLVAAFLGIFAPLMYQSAVQGRRPLTEAVREGWRLGREHLGSMLIFWLLMLILSVAIALFAGAVRYILSLSYTASWLQWAAEISAQTQSGAPSIPPLPPINTSLLLVILALQALVSVSLYGFSQTFGLTMYAQVYRRLAGAPGLGQSASTPAPGGPPWHAGENAPVRNESSAVAETSGNDLATGRERASDVQSRADDTAAGFSPQAPGPERAVPGAARIYDLGSDLGLAVADEEEEENGNPVAG